MEANLPGISHPELLADNPLASLAPPVTEPAPAPPTEPKVWAGKYSSAEELEVAKLASDHEVTGKLLPRLAEAERKAQMFDELLARGGQPAPALRDPFDELESIGIPRDPAMRAFRSLVQAELAPLSRAIQAQQELMNEIPDYSTHAPDIQRFMVTHPELQAEFNELSVINPKIASKYAYREYQASLGTPRTSAADTPSNGAMPQTQTSARNTPEIDWPDRINKARDYAQQTGDDRYFYKVWFEAQKAKSGQKYINPDIERLS